MTHHTPTRLAACGLTLLFMSCTSPPVLPRTPNAPTHTGSMQPLPPASVISNPDAILPGRKVHDIWALDMERIPPTPPIDPKLCFSDKAHTAPHTPSIQEIADQDHRFRHRVAHVHLANRTGSAWCLNGRPQYALTETLDRYLSYAPHAREEPSALQEARFPKMSDTTARSIARLDPGAWVDVLIVLKSPPRTVGYRRCRGQANAQDCHRCVTSYVRQRVRAAQMRAAIQIEEQGGHVVRALDNSYDLGVIMQARNLNGVTALDSVDRIELDKCVSNN